MMVDLKLVPYLLMALVYALPVRAGEAASWPSIDIERRDGAAHVQVWDRQYDFGDLPFPRQMVARGEPLLNGPVGLHATIDGHDVEWEAQPLKIVQQSAEFVVIEQQANARDGSITLVAATTIEPDGMMRIDWHLKPHRPCHVDHLRFEIRLPAVRATYLNHAYNAVTRAKSQPQFGILPASGFAKHFVPFLWIGDEDRGLNWWCESDRNWLLSDSQRAVEVNQVGDEIVVQITLVSNPTDIGTPSGIAELNYTFGLMAGPARPMLRDGWDLRIVSAPAYGNDYAVLTDSIDGQRQIDRLASLGVRTLMLFNWTDTLCYPAPVGREQQLRDLLKACHDRGMRVILYFGSQMSHAAPEWPSMGQTIRIEPEMTGQERYPGMELQGVTHVCNASAYQDFLVSGIERMIDEYDIDGVYLDGVGGVWACANESHGCGYRRQDGSPAPTYTVFATRDTIRRIYDAVHSRKPDGVVWLHQSSQMILPISVWSDIVWDGEQFGDGSAFPTDVLPLDAFRCELTGRQTGTPVDFLFYTAFRPPSGSADWPGTFRKALAMSLLHDRLVCPTGMVDPAVSFPMIEIISKVWNAGEQFGRHQAEWLPYYRNSDYVTIAGGSEVHVSLYKHPSNGVLATVANLSRTSQRFAIQPRLDRLGLGAAPAVTNVMDNATVPIGDDATIDLELDSFGWKLLWMK